MNLFVCLKNYKQVYRSIWWVNKMVYCYKNGNTYGCIETVVSVMWGGSGGRDVVSLAQKKQISIKETIGFCLSYTRWMREKKFVWHSHMLRVSSTLINVALPVHYFCAYIFVSLKGFIRSKQNHFVLLYIFSLYSLA